MTIESGFIAQGEPSLRKTWKVMKESIGKRKCNHQSLPKKINLEGKNITDEDLIAKKLNTYFTEIGPKLAKTIQHLD